MNDLSYTLAVVLFLIHQSTQIYYFENIFCEASTVFGITFSIPNYRGPCKNLLRIKDLSALWIKKQHDSKDDKKIHIIQGCNFFFVLIIMFYDPFFTMCCVLLSFSTQKVQLQCKWVLCPLAAC